MSLQVVWFKRDLRTADHEALYRACATGPTLCLYVIEPAYWQQDSTSNRQWLFVREALADLDAQLRALDGALVVQQGDAVDALESIRKAYCSFVLHSHIETGIGWTFERDKAVARWCRKHEVQWYEYVQNGVCRPISSRQTGFKQHWDRWVQALKYPRPVNATFVGREPDSLRVSSLSPHAWPGTVREDVYPCPGRQTGGRSAGLDVFKSFLLERGEVYRGSISSPLTAESACSRLSPYLAYGCLGLREVVQRTMLAQRDATTRWSKSLAAFMTRLHWHCYWIQAFEAASQMEHEPLVEQMALLRRPLNKERFDAWRMGRTGWPMVDACMRFLHHQGWINFRMRAMLVCAATHSLELPWQPVSHWMAQMFVDFEPGIHYPQVQLQSAMSGGSVLRMYNPVIQASRLDPQGEFVRRWVPELAHVSQFWIFEPWKMTPNLREAAGWTQEKSYLEPLVDFAQTHRATKQAITEIRSAHQLVPVRRFHERTARVHEPSRREQLSPSQAQAPQNLSTQTLSDRPGATTARVSRTRRSQPKATKVDMSIQPTLF